MMKMYNIINVQNNFYYYPMYNVPPRKLRIPFLKNQTNKNKSNVHYYLNVQKYIIIQCIMCHQEHFADQF